MLASFHLPMPCRAACSHQPSVFRSGHLRVPLLKASLCTPSMLSSSRSTFAGTMLSRGTQQQSVSRRGVIVEANSKTSIGITKRGTRRARTRTSGFRARMQTPSGRAVLKARRKKGRHTLCPASNYRK